FTKLKSNFYTTNFEAHWRGDRAQINANVQYNWSNEGYYIVEQILRPDGLTSASIDFVSDQYRGGVPSITFNNVDLSDLGSYVVDRFQDNRGGSKNKEFAAQADLTLRLSDAHFLRNLQTGF